MRPVGGGGGGEDGAGVRVEAEAGGAGAADLPFLIPLDIIRVPADGAGAEDFKGLGRAVLVRGEGQAVAPLEFAAVAFAAVAFVADDGVLGTKAVAALQAGAFVDPVVGAVDDEGGVAVHELAVAAHVAAPEEADAGELVLGALEEVMAPRGAERFEVARLEDGIEVVVLLEAGEGAALGLAAHLPAAGVAAEEGHVAAFGDPGFQIVAHRCAPVFVMADAEDEFVVREHLGAEFEVVIGGEFERVAVGLRPHDEGQLPAGELRRARARSPASGSRSRWHLPAPDALRRAADAAQRVVIGAGETLIQWLLFPVCESIRKQNANVTFAFKNLDSERLVDSLQKGEVDVALLRKEEVPPSLTRSGEWRYTHAAFVPTALSRNTTELKLAELASLPWALLEGQGHFRQFLENRARTHGIKLNVSLECSSYTQVAMAIQTKRYAGFLPEFAKSAAFAAHSSLVQRPTEKSLRYGRTLTLAWREATMRSRPIVEQLVPVLRTQIGKVF